MMTRTMRRSLLIASMLIVAWATTSEACHRRRACAPVTYCSAGYNYGGYTYAGTTGYYGAGGGYGMAGGGYYDGGYGYGRPYNPGGLGGPFSGLGVRPGLGFGGLGPGR